MIPDLDFDALLERAARHGYEAGRLFLRGRGTACSGPWETLGEHQRDCHRAAARAALAVAFHAHSFADLLRKSEANKADRARRARAANAETQSEGA